MGAWGRGAPGLPRAVRQSVIAGGVGIFLGLVLLGVPLFPEQYRPFFILALLGPFVAMIVGQVRRLLLAMIMLDIPNKLDINFAYRYDLAELNAIGGIHISATTAALVGLYVLWAAESLSRMSNRPASRIWTGGGVALAAYLGFVILSMVVAHDVMLAFFEIFMLVQMFLLYIYIIATVRTREEVMFIVTLLLVGLLAESLIMIGLRVAGRSFTIAGVLARIDESGRVGGTVGSPNGAASYLSLFLPLAASCLLARLGRGYKLLAALAFCGGAMALALTLSRGGWVAFVIAMTLLYLAAWRRGRLSLAAPIIAIVAALLIWGLFQEAIAARLVGDDASPPEARLYMMKLAWKMIQDNPMLGVGANNFAIMIPRYASPEFSGEWLHVVHNKYLLVWSETGIGALIAFLLFLTATIRRGLQGWKLNDQLLSPLALGLTAGIVGQMGHMFVDIFHSRAQVESLWVVAALLVAIYSIGGARDNDASMAPEARSIARSSVPGQSQASAPEA